MLKHSELVMIKKVPGKGRGVFARQDIPKGAIIEKVPVLIVPVRHLVDGFDNPTLNRFFFIWEKDVVAVCLGYGSLYNHSFQPNARYDEDGPSRMIFSAIRPIQKGEEICINYNGDPKCKDPVSFKVV